MTTTELNIGKPKLDLANLNLPFIACVDGVWSFRDNAPVPEQALVLLTTKAARLWHENHTVETHIEALAPLPDIEALNAAIPKSDWEIDQMRGEPRPPWRLDYVVYFLDPKDANLFIFSNSTIGARICVDRLRNKIEWMQALRGCAVLPLVTFAARPMRTRFGTKQRPELVPGSWHQFGDGDQGSGLKLLPPVATD